MSVIIQINGREAIPVRALPWLTAWEFSADEVAEALAHDEGYESFANLESYRLDDGAIQAVRVGEWLNSVTVSIEELAERKLSRAEWEKLSMSALPACTFVWRDDWEPAYNQSPFGPDALAALGEAADRHDIAKRKLNFAPHIPLYLVQLVMEGFTKWGAQIPAPAQNATPAPVVPAGHWQQLAQQKAREYIKQQRERDCYPSQEAIGDWIATDFRKSGIVGSDGKPITGATIKRHALKGISSATGKQLSTAIGRGK